MKEIVKSTLVTLLLASSLPVVAAAADKAIVYPTRGCLTRAFSRMSRSTAERPETIRVLFYGQSIVGQRIWCDQVIDGWKKKYPTVNFIVRNRAIGGYATDELVCCMEADIFPFYPDVVMFHDYGDVLGGYGFILRQVRMRTTAEIAVWSSHLRSDEKPDAIFRLRAGEKLARKDFDPEIRGDERTQEIRAVADELDLVFVDLQGHWAKMIMDRKCTPQYLLRDAVHLNKTGFGPYSEILLGQLTTGAEGDDGEGAASGTIRWIPFAQGAKVEKNGDITIEFEGNRLAVVSNGKGCVEPGIGVRATCGEVLVDGVPVKDLQSQWMFTRSTPICSWFPGCDTPLKGKTRLLDEKWTLTITSFVTNAQPKYVTYRVEGSETGPDGEGCSTNLFVSKSGRLVIPGQWFASTCSPWHTRGPVGEVSKTVFNARLVPTPCYGPQPAGTETVLVQDIPNGKHTLTIRNPHGDLGIETIIVNCPNPKWSRPLTDRMKKFLNHVSRKQCTVDVLGWR